MPGVPPYLTYLLLPGHLPPKFSFTHELTSLLGAMTRHDFLISFCMFPLQLSNVQHAADSQRRAEGTEVNKMDVISFKS